MYEFKAALEKENIHHQIVIIFKSLQEAWLAFSFVCQRNDLK